MAADTSQLRPARRTMRSSLAFQSGRALKEFYGDDADGLVETLKTQAKGGGQTGGSFIAVGKDGVPYKFPTAEAAAEFKKRGG